MPARMSHRVTMLISAMVMIFAVSSQAQTFKTLYSFQCSSDGQYPIGGLIPAPNNNLYGTTSSGGAVGFGGTIFELTHSGAETVLYRFTGGNDGYDVVGNLLLDSSGNLYGAAAAGGVSLFFGTIFRLSPDGTFTVLHSFTGAPDDGAYPNGGLIQDQAGNLYGTTYGGGPHNYGTIYRLSPDGSQYKVLHFFTQAEGDELKSGMTWDEAGNLYGTALGGGTFDKGTAFELSPDGTLTVLHSFSGAPEDGAYPQGHLIRDSSGNLYGTTSEGGSSARCSFHACGTVFKLDPSGNESILLSLGHKRDGKFPLAGLLADTKGDLYGTTAAGGLGGGTVFQLDPTGKEKILHTFSMSDGYAPSADLVFTQGSVYGTAEFGGTANCGTVFELSIP